MLKPSATVSQIVEESDGWVEHEDTNSVQEPQSEDHDIEDQCHTSNIVGLLKHCQTLYGDSYKQKEDDGSKNNVDLLDDLLDDWNAATTVMEDIICQIAIQNQQEDEDIRKSCWLILYIFRLNSEGFFEVFYYVLLLVYFHGKTPTHSSATYAIINLYRNF